MRTAVVVLLALVLTAPVVADHGPPPAKPKRIKGGESFPPLPLPVTPLRRTERKREPAPPALIGKIRYGKPSMWVDSDGKRYLINDWESEKGDLRNLLKRAGQAIGTRYRFEVVDLKGFDRDPDRLPILYITGHQALDLDDSQRKTLREYLVNGGTIFANACHGDRRFVTAFKAEMARIFPEKSLTRLPPDHPVFLSVTNVEHVSYTPEAKEKTGLPNLLGINLGCRTAVFLSPLDISCAWAGVRHKKCPSWETGDGIKLGVNMIAYALAYLPLGKFLRTTKVYYEEEKRARGDFVFAQLRHAGEWDPDPSAAANLLRAVATLTSAKVKFKRVPVTLDDDLSGIPFLYVTGHEDFRLTDAQSGRLRRFLQTGGFVLADACCGRRAFDTAFRREMRRALPTSELTPLAPDHPLFATHLTIGEIAYTPLLSRERPGLRHAQLEGAEIDGVLRVLYSRYDLGNGWEGVDHPFTRGVAAEDALKIAVNAIVYAMTH